jgi:hypothetical protein
MAKIIKLKQSDIEKIVENILKESEGFDDFDTQIQPEERPGADEHEDSVELALGQDDQGNFYVIKNSDQENPEIVLKTK